VVKVLHELTHLRSRVGNTACSTSYDLIRSTFLCKILASNKHKRRLSINLGAFCKISVVYIPSADAPSPENNDTKPVKSETAFCWRGKYLLLDSTVILVSLILLIMFVMDEP
jgi:hypothetical protein